jgi:hypothetical protein
MAPSDQRHFQASSHREKIVEHLFVGELLRHLWVVGAAGVDILKPEVDRAGYDVVAVKGALIRHVQLKASIVGGRAASQGINASLADHASGCVVWILVDDALATRGFLWFGGLPGEPLPDLSKYRQAKNTRANASGVKAMRANTRIVPKSAFVAVADMPALATRLFGQVAG